MPGPFQYWLFRQLPSYFKIGDSYKDINDRGLIERYLEIFGLELDEEYIPQIENYINIIDPLVADSKFLNHIAYTLGNPPDLWENAPNHTEYRRLLSIILSIYKVKGTLLSYQTLFSLIGYTVSLQMNFVECTYYDDEDELALPITYDADELEHYDTCCEPCVPYNILISNQIECLPLSETPPPTFTFDATAFEVDEVVEKILCLIEPINAKLENYIPTVFACETMEGLVEEEVTAIFYEYTTYDENLLLLYDNSEEYDEVTSTPITIYP